MPIPVVCGSCGTKLVAPDAAAGKKVKCRNCQAIIPVPEAVAEEFEFVEDAPVVAVKPVTPAKPKPKPVVVVDEDEGEFEFDAAPKKKAKAAIVVEDDEDDEPPAPKKKPKPKLVRDDDDDETEEEEATKSKNKKGKKPAKKKANPLMLVGIGAVALIAVGFLGTMIWYVAFREKTTTAAGTSINAAPGGGAAKDPLAGWTKFDKVGYTAYFKDSLGAPKSISNVQQGGKLETLAVGEGPGSRNGMLVVTTEFQPAVFDVVKKNPSVAFDNGVKGMTRNGTIQSTKDTTVEGNPAREVKMRQNDGSEGIIRMVLAHNRLYIYGVIDPGISEASEVYKTFFENFKLKP